MKEFSFTVQKTGWIHVEADSLEVLKQDYKRTSVTTMWLLKLAKNCQMVGKPQAK